MRIVVRLAASLVVLVIGVMPKPALANHGNRFNHWGKYYSPLVAANFRLS